MPYNINVFQPFFLPPEQRVRIPWGNVFDNPLAPEGDQAEYPVVGDIHDVHMIGRQTLTAITDNDNIQNAYNCAAFVFGVHNRWLLLDYLQNGLSLPDDEPSLKLWITHYRNKLGAANITPSLRVAANIQIIPVQVNLPNAEDWKDYYDIDMHGVTRLDNNNLYVPQLNDVAVYFHPIEGGVCHVALYTNLNAITGVNVQLGPRWYSKCGQEYLVAHSLERMDKQYPHEENFYLNFENANDNDFRGIGEVMENIFNTTGYGNLSYIIRG